jgi:hypothetical protein
MPRKAKKVKTQKTAKRGRGPAKKPARQKVDMASLKEHHKKTMQDLRQSQLDHFMDMMDKANRIMHDTSADPADIAAAAQTYNDMQQNIQRVKMELETPPVNG